MTSNFSKYLFGVLLLFKPLSCFAQVLLQGHVFEENSQTPISYVTVFDSLDLNVTSTDDSGYFSISVRKLPVYLTFQHIGYKNHSVEITQEGIIKLFLEGNQMDEVVITGISSFHDTRSGQISINKSVIKALPTIGGEVDYISSLVLFPGVSNGEEISKGFTVRGGSLDQNISHINGIQTSNTGHLFNLYSAVPAVAVEDLVFYKGGMPASFGNALSSAMDVKLKRPGQQAFSLDIGATNSKASYENTFGKNKKSSYLLSGRTSYLDLIRKKAYRNTLNDFHLRGQAANGTEYHFGYTFYDILGLVNINWGKGLELSGFGLYSYDKNTYIYNRSHVTFLKHELYNGTYGLSLSKYWNNKNSLSIKMGINENEVNRYERTVEFKHSTIRTEDAMLNHSYAIQTWTGKLDYIHQVSDHHFSTGIFTYYKQFQPGIGQLQNFSYDPILRTGDTTLLTNTNEVFAILMAGAYTQADLKWSNLIELNIGLRGTSYFASPNTLFALEPRAAITYKLSPTSHLRGSFDYLTQFDHGLVLSEVGLDNIIFLPSIGDIKPAKSLNYSLGAITRHLDHRLIMSGEVFFKDQKNLQRLVLDSKDNIVSDSISELIAKNGTGYAYGAEFQLTFQSDDLVFNSSYTFGRSIRKFKGFNQDKAYPFDFDKPHEVSISGVMGLGKKSTFSMIFSLYNGRRYTVPSGQNKSFFRLDPILIYDGFQNAVKQPIYHRLDIGYDYTFKLGKKWKGMIKLNVINVYNRPNINFVELRKNNDGSYTQEGVSYIPILPSVNLRFSYE